MKMKLETTLLYPSEANYVKKHEVSQLVYTKTAINLAVASLQARIYHLVPLKSFGERR
jgi:hypothetical protein